MSGPKSLLIQIFTQDSPGLVSAISSCLFELGLNLGDTTFAVLGTGAEFTAVVEEPVPVTVSEIEQRLSELPELEGAEIQVEEFDVEPTHSPQAEVTHRFVVRGQDQPGLVARLTEVFLDYGANIVRLNAEREVERNQSTYVLRISAWIPESRAEACVAAVTNTASQLQLFSQWYRA